MVAVIGELVPLVAVNNGTLPDPLAARPIAVLLFVHENVVPLTGPEKVVTGTVIPSQKFWLLIALTVGVGFTVTAVEADLAEHPFASVTVTL